VARLAGVPEEVLGRAREVLAELESHPVSLQERPTAPGRRRRRAPDAQPGLFDDVK
jgi:DNA mismatch repair protein MutS